MARPSLSRGRRPIALLAAAATGMSGVALLGPSTGSASSHREAPYTAGNPRVDNTDVYSFVSPDKPDTVTLVANWRPFQEPDGGPNFYRFDDEAQYDINIDNNGDARADVTYRWTFDSGYRNLDTFLYNTGVVTTLDDPDLNFRQTYDLQVISNGTTTTLVDNAPVAPSNVGPASMPNYAALRAGAVRPIGAQGAGGQVFAGQADDPFFLDLRIFDLLYGGDLSEVGNDTLNGYNVQSVALQVPKSAVALAGNAANNPVIGIWSTTQQRSTRVLNTDGTTAETGDFVQVSRLGNPLVNEVIIPVKDKDRFNNSSPARDTQFLPYVQSPEVPRLIEAIYKIPAPDSDNSQAGTQRADLISVFLTGVDKVNDLNVNQGVTTSTPAEMLRLNMAVAPTARPNRLGVIGGDNAGFPNGRRLTDDVVDISLQVLEGELLKNPNDLGDAVSSNDLPFMGSFPYVALPHNSAVNQSQFIGFSRLAGQDRYATAATIARATFQQADTVLLASGLERNLPDALAGNYLAGVHKAPILLTTPTGLPQVTKEALVALGAKRVIILGGPQAVNAAQAGVLDDTYAVERIGGRDRYETAALIATRPLPAGMVASKTAIVARGDVFPDALVSGPLSYVAGFPILLTRPGGIDTFTTDALRKLGTTDVVIAGGTAAVSTNAETQLKNARGAATVSIRRFAGADRLATAVAMARYATAELGFVRTHVNLARGDLMVDAVAGGPHAGAERSVILLTTGSSLGAPTRDYLVAESITLETGHVFGGPAAVSAATVAEAADAANSDDAFKLASKR